MKKIIVFGDLPIATKVSKLIMHDKKSKLFAIVIGNARPKNNDPFNDELLIDYAQKKNISIINIHDIDKFEDKFFDLGITVRFSKIIGEETLKKFKIGILNFHGGLLPEYGGLYSSVHSILNREKKGGGTLHWLDKKIDTGNILKRCDFEIKKSDTSFSVFQKTQKILFNEFKNIYQDILNNNYVSFTQKEYIEKGFTKRYFNINSLNGKKKINISNLISNNKDLVEIELAKIRAFDFPGYESSYIEINGHKLFLRVNSEL